MSRIALSGGVKAIDDGQPMPFESRCRATDAKKASCVIAADDAFGFAAISRTTAGVGPPQPLRP